MCGWNWGFTLNFIQMTFFFHMTTQKLFEILIKNIIRSYSICGTRMCVCVCVCVWRWGWGWGVGGGVCFGIGSIFHMIYRATHGTLAWTYVMQRVFCQSSVFVATQFTAENNKVQIMNPCVQAPYTDSNNLGANRGYSSNWFCLEKYPQLSAQAYIFGLRWVCYELVLIAYYSIHLPGWLQKWLNLITAPGSVSNEPGSVTWLAIKYLKSVSCRNHTEKITILCPQNITF